MKDSCDYFARLLSVRSKGRSLNYTLYMFILYTHNISMGTGEKMPTTLLLLIHLLGPQLKIHFGSHPETLPFRGTQKILRDV